MRLLLVLLFVLPIACGRGSPHTPPGGPAPSSTATASPAVTPPAAPARFSPCGPLDCREYDSPTEAFHDATEGGPLVVGIGEAHAQKGAVARSSAARFADEILPSLSGRASDLLLELMMPPSGCVDATAEVRERQKPVAEKQAEHAQNDYVAMGNKAKAVGIVPDLLRPSCADMDAVRDAGEGAIAASLELIAKLTRLQARKLVDRDARSDADAGKFVLIYGGLLHNDLAPSPDQEAWSYAPDLDGYVQHRFVAIDLIVPEFIGDDANWRALPWTAHYDRAAMGAKTILFRTGERSFVLVFAAGPG